MKKEIDIKLKATSDPSGIVKTTAHLKGLGEVAGKVGEAFGGATTYIGQFAKNLLRGGIWEAGASVLGFLVKKVIEFWKSSEEAAKKAAEEERKAFDGRVKAVGEYQAAIEKCHSASVAAADARLKQITAEIDAVNDLRKAELELERERLRAAGDTAGAAGIDGRLAALDADASAAKIAAEMEAAERRIAAARQKSEDMPLAEAAAKSAAEQAAAAYEAAARAVRAKAEKSALGDAYFVGTGYGGHMAFQSATDEQRRAAGAAAVDEWEKSEEHGKLAESKKAAEAALKSASEARLKAEEELAAAESHLANLETKAEALLVRTEAKAEKAKNDAADAARKTADETRAAEVKAAQDAARERERLDRELHQKRMADLRAEIAEQTKGANGLRAAAAAAQSEFDRAFAMYRDPSRAAAEIAEEKDYREDLDRLHRDARRYGGKWRIDELSRLMAAGDSQGASDTLAEWRKSSRFTPEVEAMVRASAAEMTKTTAEDELRKIESNTAGLAEKLDELLSMKGGS